MISPYEALKQSRIQALDLSTTVGRGRLRTMLERAERELVLRLHHDPYLSGRGKDSFTAAQLQATLRHVREVTRNLAHGIEKIVRNQAGEAVQQSVQGTIEYLNAAERLFRGSAAQPLPLSEIKMLDRAAVGVNASVLRRLGSGSAVSAEDGGVPDGSTPQTGILQRYGMSTIGDFEDSLQQGLLQKKSWADVRGSLVEQSPFLQGAPAHWAERIVRTETMGAYNKAGWESIRSADTQLGDMCKILAATFDSRTGWDSYQVHGQIRMPEQAFEWAGGYFQHPPNRPNDREVVVPHRISWPIPPYLQWKTDGQVNARFRQEGRKGVPPPRPLMTTIPLSRFGQ